MLGWHEDIAQMDWDQIDAVDGIRGRYCQWHYRGPAGIVPLKRRKPERQKNPCGDQWVFRR